MKLEVKSESNPDVVYTVDTERVTCTCPQFKYRCSHHPLGDENRICKHIQEVFDEHPELIPSIYQKAYSDEDTASQNQVDPDGKKRYPRQLFDMYVKDIKSIAKQFPNIIDKLEICGSYRRLAKTVSDIDCLIQLKLDENGEAVKWDPFLDYCEKVMGWKLIQEIGRGEAKAAYMIDGFVHVDFMNIRPEQWPFALLHFTGSKYTNINMRRRANSLGFTLNQYGIKGVDGNFVEGLKSEKDIFNFLKLPYKEPWDR